MSLENLGREVRRHQDLDAERRLAVRERLLEASPVPRDRRPWLGLVAVAAAATLVWATWPSAQEIPLTFVVAGQAGQREAFVSAPLTALELSFSDGSVVELAKGSSARIDALTVRGATLRIEDGRADVNVVHRDVTEWKVQAGPYTVIVVGTRFSVEWDARSGEFEVAMREGRVEVEGPDGFRTVLEGTDVLHRAPAAAPIDEEQPQPEHVEVAPVAEVRPVRGSLRPPSSAQVDTPDWRALVASGHYDDARDALDTQALSRLLERGSVDDLELLGVTLRRARDPREQRVWRGYRERFMGSDGAADAAFHLARYAFHHGTLAESERWLTTYLREAPRGRWEMEARGRLVEVRVRRGADPQRAAETYLEHFPDGPHAPLATSLVGGR